MATLNETAFLSLVAFQVAQLAVARARRVVRSRAIKRELVPQFIPELSSPRVGRSRAHIPFFWARYYHDGRGPVRSRRGRKIVFYKNVDNDPRTGGGARDYPKRKRDRRRLSKSQFSRDMRAGKLVAVESVGATGGTFFFTRGMRQFPGEVSRKVARPNFSRHVLEGLRADGNLRSRPRRITLVV